LLNHQDGSQGAAAEQRDSQNPTSSGRAQSAATDSWHTETLPAESPEPASVITDSAISVYV
jgi:hypothetical protein